MQGRGAPFQANSREGGFGLPEVKPRQVQRAGFHAPTQRAARCPQGTLPALHEWAKGLLQPKDRPPKRVAVRSRTSQEPEEWHRNYKRDLGELERH